MRGDVAMAIPIGSLGARMLRPDPVPNGPHPRGPPRIPGGIPTIRPHGIGPTDPTSPPAVRGVPSCLRCCRASGDSVRRSDRPDRAYDERSFSATNPGRAPAVVLVGHGAFPTLTGPSGTP